MSRLDVLEDALIALARCLHAHGPACVCVPCTALTASQALLPRLAHVLVVLEAWSADVAGEPYRAQDLGLLLTLLDEGSPPAAGAVMQRASGLDPRITRRGGRAQTAAVAPAPG